MVVWWALAAAAGALLAVTLGTARPAVEAVPDLEGYLARWQGVHGGYEPRSSRVVARWLRLVHALARPLAAAGLRPDALTLWGVWVAAVAAALAVEGGAWPILAGLLLVVSGVGDALDGAVAVLTGRESRWGHVLDSVADRASDLLGVAAVWAVGAPGWLAAATAVGILLLEYVRARAAVAGAGEVGAVTVAERPSRVIGCGATLAAVGAARIADAGQEAATSLAAVGLGVLAALTVVGLAQLLWAVRRRLRAEEGSG